MSINNLNALLAKEIRLVRTLPDSDGPEFFTMSTTRNQKKFRFSLNKKDTNSDSNRIFIVTYGTVGKSVNVERHTLDEWNDIYRQKISEGYEDVTQYYDVNDDVPESDKYTLDEIRRLKGFDQALAMIDNAEDVPLAENYDNMNFVTVRMIQHAWKILDEMEKDSENADNSAEYFNKFNEKLMQVLRILPRKIKGNLRKKLLQISEDAPTTRVQSRARKILCRERSYIKKVLESLKEFSTSDIYAPAKEKIERKSAKNNSGDIIGALSDRLTQQINSINDSITVENAKNSKISVAEKSFEEVQADLKKYEVEIRKKDKRLINIVKNAFLYKNPDFDNPAAYSSTSGDGLKPTDCWYIVNKTTEARYEADKNRHKGKGRSKERYLWHASKDLNWLSIICKGLKVQSSLTRNSDEGWLGKGIYFTNTFSVADFYALDYVSKKNYLKPIYIPLFKVRVGNAYMVPELIDMDSERYDFSRISFRDEFADYDSVSAYTAAEAFEENMPKFYKGLKEEQYKNMLEQYRIDDEICIYNPSQCTIFALVEFATVYENKDTDGMREFGKTLLFEE